MKKITAEDGALDNKTGLIIVVLVIGFTVLFILSIMIGTWPVFMHGPRTTITVIVTNTYAPSSKTPGYIPSTGSSTIITGPGNANETPGYVAGCRVISLKNYTPVWRGSDHMPELFNPPNGSSYTIYDLWPNIGPHTCSYFYEYPYKCLANVSDAVIRGKVEELTSIKCSGITCNLVYRVKVIDVYKGDINNDYVEIYVRAWPAREYLDNVSAIDDLSEIAVPYPLIDVGYEYILFLQYIDGKLFLIDDWVWGYHAYLVLGDNVYSLNLINISIKLDPEEVFVRDNVAWWPENYSKLHWIYTEVFTYCGPLEDFLRAMGVSEKHA